MKKIAFIFLSIFIASTLLAQSIYAADHVQPTTTSDEMSPTVIQNKVLNSTSKDMTRLTNIKGQADSWITERITALQKLLTKAQESKVNTSSEVTQLTTDIQTAIAGLTTLKTQIDGVTTTSQLGTLLTQVKSIFTNFRVFEEQIPKDHTLLHIAQLKTFSTHFTSYEQNLLQDITYAQGQKVDVTILETDNTKFTTDIAKFNTDIATIESLANTLKPQTVSITQTTINQIKTDFALLHTDIENIRADHKKFITDFKSLFPSTTTTPTITTGVSPTPTK